MELIEMNKGEMHLLVIWERARYQQDKIVEDLEQQFKVLNCFEVEWSENSVSNNFTRFYGVSLPDHSFKEKECGVGKFLLFIIWDANPIYENRETSHGIEIVNTRMFDVKSKYRSWTGGGHKIHATNSPQETNHDLTLLLGINSMDYIDKYGLEKWNGNIIELHRDITGNDGWNNLKELFYVLNNTITYVVMRGEENLEGNKLLEHGDIDILVKEWQNAIFIMNSKHVRYDSIVRPKILIKTLEDGEFLFDLWDSALPYHSQGWHEEMFKTREKHGLYYILNEENHFYSLIYHSLVHKMKIAEDYLSLLEEQFHNLGLDQLYPLDQYQFPMDLYFQILLEYMKTRKYEFLDVKEDSHCFYNPLISKIDPALAALKKIEGLSDVRPYRVGNYSMSLYVYFVANYRNRKVFIKYGGVGNSCLNEYNMTKRAYEYAPKHFLQPIFFSKEGPYIIYEYVEGVPLEMLLKDICTYNDLDSIGNQIFELYEALKNTNIIHRDIRPENIIVVDGRVILLDLQFALNISEKKEVEGLNFEMACGLGKEYRYKEYAWNDGASFRKLAEEFQLTSIVDKIEISKEYTVYMPLLYSIKLYRLKAILKYQYGLKVIKRLLWNLKK